MNPAIKMFDSRWKKRSKLMNTGAKVKGTTIKSIDDPTIKCENMNYSENYFENIEDIIKEENNNYCLNHHAILKEGAKDAEKIFQLENEQDLLREEIKELRLSLKDQALMKQQINDLHLQLIINKTSSHSTSDNIVDDSGEVSPVSVQASIEQMIPLKSDRKTVHFFSHLNIDNQSKDISWEIPNFDLSKPLYESQIFDYENQTYNLAFGQNNENGYGFIVSLIEPQIRSSRVDCTFRLHDPSSEFPYIKTIAKQCVLETAKISGGFARFASKEKVRNYIQDGTLKISATLVFLGPTSNKTNHNRIRRTIEKTSTSFVDAVLSFFKWVAIKLCRHRNSRKKRKIKNTKTGLDAMLRHNITDNTKNNYPSNLTCSTGFSNITSSSIKTPEMKTSIHEQQHNKHGGNLTFRKTKKKR